MLSNIFFTVYTEWIQALANNHTWADQVGISESKGLALFYITLKVEKTQCQ